MVTLIKTTTKMVSVLVAQSVDFLFVLPKRW